MSTNGQSPDTHINWNPEVTLSGVPLSAAQREAQRIAYVAAVDNMALTLAEVVKAHDTLLSRFAALQADYDGHIKWHNTNTPNTAKRLDALDRVTAARWNLPLWYRLRWMVLGR